MSETTSSESALTPNPLQIDPPKKKSSMGKIVAIGCGGLLGLTLLIVVAYYALVPKEERDRLAAERRAEKEATSQIERQRKTDEPTESPAVNTRTGLRASTFETQLSKTGIDFVFEQSPLNDGMPRSIATSPTVKLALVELTGDRNDLKKVWVTWLISNTDESQNLMAAATLSLVANIAHDGASKWVVKNADRMSRNQAFTDSTVFDGNTFKLMFSPTVGRRTLSLSVE